MSASYQKSGQNSKESQSYETFNGWPKFKVNIIENKKVIKLWRHNVFKKMKKEFKWLAYAITKKTIQWKKLVYFTTSGVTIVLENSHSALKTKTLYK